MQRGEFHGDLNKVGCYDSYALVVMPTSIEMSQIAKLPIRQIVDRLRTLLSTTPNEALRYARSVVHHHPVWDVSMSDWDVYIDFFKIVLAFDDYQLFIDILGTVELLRVDSSRTLLKGIEHFGWDGCIEAVKKRLLSLRLLDDRIKFRLSVISRYYERPTELEYLNRLFDALVSLRLWSRPQIVLTQSKRFREQPGVDDFMLLLDLAHRLSFERMKQIALINDPDLTVQVVARDIVRRLRKHPHSSIRLLLPHVWEVYKPMSADLRHACYAGY